MPNRHSTLNSLFTDIATAIRNKKGESSSTTYKADDFDTAISAIPTGVKEEDDPATMTSQLATVAEGEAYLYTGTSTTDYKNGRLYVAEENPLSIPLCFTANTAGSTVTLTKNGSPSWTGSYSTDGINWITYEPGATGVITLTNIGDKVYFKGDITAHFLYQENYLQFIMTGSIAASGNCNSMYISTGFENLTTLTYNYCYYGLFKNCESLTSAPLLPATILTREAPEEWLTDGCYNSMFWGCTSLTTPPALPATTLGRAIYSSMFRGCINLLTAPELPATTLTDSCYYCMFYDCTSLTTSPTLPATTLKQSCYGHMFNGCTALTTMPNLPITTFANNSCSYSMFENCTSLQVNDSLVSGVAEQTWRVPTTGTFTNTYTQSSMFRNCLGTRSSDNLAAVAGQSCTYYTQNAPV